MLSPLSSTQEDESATITADVVILIHGIRTRAPWQHDIRQSLEARGFQVELTSYEYFDIIRFLFPSDRFRSQVVDRIATQIISVRQLHPESRISVIAHSFGTYVISRILRQRFELNFHRIILCGSVVPATFEFSQITNRFTQPVLNECGTRDYWPVMAQSVTFGYGSTGTHGFKTPLVRDRWHNKLRHSDFLTSKFCECYWIPFLKVGKIIEAQAEHEKVPFWIEWPVLFKPLVIAATLFLCSWWYLYEPPSNYSAYANGAGIAFPGDVIAGIYRELASPCLDLCLVEALRNRDCIRISTYDRRVESIRIQGSFECDECRPLTALLRFKEEHEGCLEIQGIDEEQLVVGLGSSMQSTCDPSDGLEAEECICK